MANLFNILRNETKPETVSASSLHESAEVLNEIISFVIASQIRRQRNMPGLGISRQESEAKLTRAKKEAQVLLAHERMGETLQRPNFSESVWRHLIDVTSVQDAKRFAESPYMSPSMVVRVVLSMSLDQ